MLDFREQNWSDNAIAENKLRAQTYVKDLLVRIQYVDVNTINLSSFLAQV